MPHPLVTVIVPAHNAGPFLAETLESIFAQDYPALEILVGNDSSTDDTAAVLARYGSRIRVFDFTKAGEGGNRNRLIAHARGQYIANLDADDLWRPGKLHAQVAALQARPDAVLCHTGTELFGSDSGDGPATAEERARLDGHCFDALFRANRLLPSASMWRRDAAAGLGFPEDVPYGVDYTFFLQLLVTRPAVYLPTVYTRYRRHPQQATAADRVQRYQVYNCLARLRVLHTHGHLLPPDHRATLRAWALEELRTHAYSRYWHHDHRLASLGFRTLRAEGQPVKLLHRARAAVMARLAPA